MAMSLDEQQALRNNLAGQCFDHIDADTMNTVHCFVALMGAAAIVAAVLPKPSREKLIDAAIENLGAHADKRAEEMRSGDLDRQFTAN